MKNLITITVALLLMLTSCKKDKFTPLAEAKNAVSTTSVTTVYSVTLTAFHAEEYVYLKKTTDANFIFQPYVTTHSLTITASTGDSIKVAFFPHKPDASLIVVAGTDTLVPVRNDTVPPFNSNIYFKLP